MFETDDFGLDDDEIFDKAITSTQKITKTSTADEKPSPRAQSKSSKVLQRKFPGPAGLLPEQFSSTDETLNENVCSQSSHNVFETDQWLNMCRDFKSETFLPSVYTVQWIKSKALSKSLVNQKAPFLAAIIKNRETFSTRKSFTLLLRDLTGEIRATILQELFDNYINELTIGSVIVLKQFSVLTIDNISYINITLKNLVRIYSADKVTNVQHITMDDLMKSIEETKRKNEKFVVPPPPRINKRCLPPIKTEEKAKKLRFEHEQNENSIVEDILEGLNPDSIFEDF